MASPAFLALGGPGTGTSTSFTATEPAGSTTDTIVYLAIVVEDTHTGFTGPSGWTLIGSQDIGAFTGRLYGIRRTGSAPAYNCSWTTSRYYEWTTYAFTGGATTGPVYESITMATPDTSVSPPDCPSATSTTADTLFFALGWHWSGFSSATSAPSGYTIRFSGVGGYDHCAASKAVAAAGSDDPGAFSGGITASDNRGGWTIVIPSIASGAAATSDPIESAAMRQLRTNAIYRMSPENDARAQKFLRARKAYGFPAAAAP